MPPQPIADSELTLELGGLRLGLRLAPGRLAEALRSRYRLFLSRAAPHYSLRVETLPAARDRQPRPFLPRVESLPGRLSFTRGDASCHIDLRSRTGELRVWPNSYSFDAALRIIYSQLLAKEGAFFLHAAALCDDGPALVFPGPSGSGKTTLLRTCTEQLPLGDELVLLRRRKGAFEALSTPFWGNGRKARARLGRRIGGLFFLERSGGLLIRRVAKAEAQRLALKSLLWFSEEPGALSRLWDELLSLVGQVPTFSLSYRRGSSPWPVVQEILGRSSICSDRPRRLLTA